MSGGVCDVPGERCHHAISCAERGCVKKRRTPMTAPEPDVAAVARGLTKAQRKALLRATWSDASGVWHPEGWFANADRRVRYNLCRLKLARDYLRPCCRLTPLGLLVRAHLLAERPTDAG